MASPHKTVSKLMQIRLPLDLHAALMEFSEVTGMPATAFVRSVLIDSLPTIRQLTAAARAAKSNEAHEALTTMRDMLVEKTSLVSQRSFELTSELNGKGAPDA